MTRTHIVLMSLAWAAIFHPALKQLPTPVAGSQEKTDRTQQTEDQSGKSQVKNRKGAASSATGSPRQPSDITESGKVFLDGCSAIDKPPSQLNSYETHSNVQCLSYVDGIFESLSLADHAHIGPHGFCAS